MWPYGLNKPRDFVEHWNSIHQNIHFTMRMGIDVHLHLLDIDIYRGR
jgi:hypothetical protein